MGILDAPHGSELNFDSIEGEAMIGLLQDQVLARLVSGVEPAGRLALLENDRLGNRESEFGGHQFLCG